MRTSDPPPIAGAPQSNWDLASDAFLKCWPLLERFEQPVSERLIELARIGVGDTVVDVATGIGEPALTVARRLGPAGRVIAIDQSSAMLAVAAARAQDAGLMNIEFRHVDANRMDLPRRGVNAVLCRWGLMFVTDLADALARMQQCLVPGGRLAAAVWSEPAKVPIITVRRNIMHAFDIPPGAHDPFRLSSEDRLGTAASGAGFVEVRIDRATIEYEFPSADAYVDVQRALHESRLASLRDRSREEQAAFWRAVSDAAAAYADEAGTIHMPSEILLLTARAPS